jgi:hypothetical protein
MPVHWTSQHPVLLDNSSSINFCNTRTVIVELQPALKQEQLEQGHEGLPREAPVLSKIMSPAALTDLHWARVPAVVLFGCFVADEDGEFNVAGNGAMETYCRNVTTFL